MYGILVNDIDNALAYLLVGFYLDGEHSLSDNTDQLSLDFESECGSDVTSGAWAIFTDIMEGLGYKFYCPWDEHDGQYIILPDQDYDAECKRIDTEVRAWADGLGDEPADWVWIGKGKIEGCENRWLYALKHGGQYYAAQPNQNQWQLFTVDDTGGSDDPIPWDDLPEAIACFEANTSEESA